MIISDFSMFAIYACFCLVYMLAINERIRSFANCLITGVLCLGVFLGVHYYLYQILDPRLFTFYFPITGLMVGMFYSIYISPHSGAKAVFPFLISVFFITVVDSVLDIIVKGIDYGTIEQETIQILCLAISLTVTQFFLKGFFLSAIRYTNSGWVSMDMSFIIYFFIMYMMIITLADYNILPIRVGLEILMLVIFIALCLMTAKSLKEQEESYQQQMIQQQTRAFTDQADTFWESEKQISILRHDMRHRIGLIRELLEENKIEEAFNLLDDTDERLERHKSIRYCENVYVNAALVMCARKADEEDISIDFKTDIPENIDMDVHNLSVVVSNLIENGINACKKMKESGESGKRFIAVIARDTGSSLIINVRNSFNGSIRFDDNGFPISKKEGHGIGTKSVIAFIESYDGMIDYSAEENVFSVKILVNYPSWQL